MPGDRQRDSADLIGWLKENLTIAVKNGHWTDPNNRTIELKLAGEVISTAYFDVTQKPEYEG
jgi:hypothetical protein